MRDPSDTNDDALRDELRALRQRLWEIERLVRERAAPELDLPEESFDVLSFRVGRDRVALLLSEVREVLPLAEMLPLPEAPPWVSGLLDLGDRTIPVLDVAARFRRGAREADLADLVVVCHTSSRDLGLVVQEVFDVQRFERARLSPPADEVPHASYLRGTLRDDEGQLLMLSLARLLEASDVPDVDDPDALESP